MSNARRPGVFSPETLEKFEAAAASIPLRQLVRAFENAGIRAGKDPGGPDGARRVQFRAYVADVAQRDARQLDQLCAALGALIEEVADSKQAYLMQAAEQDGFAFAGGAFRAADTSRQSFAITRIEELASIGVRGRRLSLLANDDPAAAIAGAAELVESLCRTIVQALGKPAPAKSASLAKIADAALAAVEPVPGRGTDAKALSEVVARLADRTGTGIAPRHARLAAGAAITFATFLAETYAA